MLSFRSLSVAFAFAASAVIAFTSQPVRAADINVDVNVYRPRPVYVAPPRNVYIAPPRAVYVGPRRTVYVAPAPVCRWRTTRVRVGDHVAVRRVRTCF